ncbi:MAG: hypothetical protein HWQ35_11175 [Nostoc sp. NMS1]|uniref:hypothetical protein n=1 Tax=unclassified Nostoc TaxID=2593658 RepID=UPI0025DE306A|nr:MULTISPECIES: hypothetical protein [unclassified Nostoc]MBN3907093.1 hypothetical protein [Nostoc sp. NMS1]MBN3993005.1 hypothetical protein [Nostoc sp. NMS2]
MLKNKNLYQVKFIYHIIIQLTILLITPIFSLLITSKSYGGSRIPDGASIYKVQGKTINNRSLTVRHEGDSRSIRNYIPGISEVLTYRDVLGIPANKNLIATLDFLFQQNDKWDSSGYRVNTVPKPTPSEYRFPCRVSGGTFTLGWRNAGENIDRGCASGVRVGTNSVKSSLLPALNIFNSASITKSVKQDQTVNDDSVLYCGANPKSGFFVTYSGIADDSCQQTIEKCISENGSSECTLASMGEWNLNDLELNAELLCSKGPIRRHSNGSEMSNLLDELTQWVVSQELTDCAFNVYTPREQIIRPGNGQTLIRGIDTGSDILIDVLIGTVYITSINNTLGLPVKAGQRYSIANNTTAKINPQKIAESPEIKSFLDPKQSIPPNLPVNIREEIAAQIANSRTALKLPPIAPFSSYYLRVISGSGSIKNSNVAAVSVGTSVSEVAGGYDPSTRELILDIAGRQVGIVLSAPLNDNLTIPFKVIGVKPRISGEPSVSKFPKLVENVLGVLGVEGGGTLKKQGNKIQGSFTVEGKSSIGKFIIGGNNSVFEPSSPLTESTGLVNGTFSLNVQIGTSSNLPLKTFY